MKCKYCQKEFENIENHELECSHTFGNHNFENMIPCELCDELIPIEEYQEHINNCQVRNPYIYPIRLPNVNNINEFPNLNNNQVNILNHILNNINNNENNLINTLNELRNTYNNSLNTNEIQEEPSENTNEIQEEPSENTNPNPNPINFINVIPNTETIHNNIQMFITNYNSLNQNLINLQNQNINNNNIESDNYIPELEEIPNINFREDNLQTYEDLINLENRNVKVGVDIEKVSEEIELESENKCSICYENFEKKFKMRKLKCNHIYCEECLGEWLSENKKCPVCMIEL